MTKTPFHRPNAAMPPLPPAGAAWGGVVMGLSITGSLLGIHVNIVTGTIATVAAAVVLAVLLAGAALSPRFTNVPGWAMMTMGLLSFGSATDTNLGWTHVHAFTLSIGLVSSVPVLSVQCLRFTRGQVQATFPEVLPLVTPMVAATNAAQLDCPITGAVLFFTSLVTALPAFARVYSGRGRNPGRADAATAWIPLGVVGQSSTAALELTNGNAVGVVYATVMLCLGIPFAAFALKNHWGAMLHVDGPPAYNPTWWASTFPVGTCSLGTHTLAETTDVSSLDFVSTALLALLCVHVLAATITPVVMLCRR